jgi:hypothetical protein
LQAIYDLTTYPTTFDFAAWAVIARSAGCDHVHFIIDGEIAAKKYHKDVAWKRFGNILIPICRLAGLEYSVGSKQDGAQFGYHYGQVEATFKRLGEIAKLKSVINVEDKGYVTITFRDSFRNTYRNSNHEAWDKVIKYFEQRGKNVAVFPECEHTPLDLLYRMSVYAGADMNLGASGGPMSLCHFSDAPYLTFNIIPTKKPTEKTYDMRSHLAKGGFPDGSQFSFRTSRQKLIWSPDHYPIIIKAYEDMNELRLH